MGRYYYGDIHGKFWVGVQSSDDASFFGVNPQDEYRYHGCHCSATEEVTGDSDHDQLLYCQQCYDSYVQHYEDTIDQRDDMIIYLSNEIRYEFDISDMETLDNTIRLLEEHVGQFMNHYIIHTDNNGISYEYSHPNQEPTENQLHSIARLCLGKQIKYCIEQNGSCRFSAEC